MAKYKFEEDKDESLKQMLEAIKTKPKPKKDEFDPSRLPWLKVKEGESLDWRIVKVLNGDTFHMEKQHYVAGIDIDGVVIPPNVMYAPCTQTSKCFGEQLWNYIKTKKSVTEFKSEENKALFKMMGSCEPQDTLFVVGIDRRDNKLKVFQTPKLVGQAFLEKAMSKKYGNPAHPTKGYDWKLTRVAKNKWDCNPTDDAVPLTEDELKLLQACEFTWTNVSSKFTQEAQDKLGVRFGQKDASQNNQAASDASNAVETPVNPPDVTAVVDGDDDIPF